LRGLVVGCAYVGIVAIAVVVVHAVLSGIGGEDLQVLGEIATVVSVVLAVVSMCYIYTTSEGTTATLVEIRSDNAKLIRGLGRFPGDFR